MEIKLLTNQEEPPMALLLEADPSVNMIKKYVNNGYCYVGYDPDLVGVYVLLEKDKDTVELMNIAVSPAEQGKGYGKQLLLDCINRAKILGCKRLEVGTGNSSIDQLAFYQKCGFRIADIEKDFFMKNYEEAIIENGIVCRDMIRLTINLID